MTLLSQKFEKNYRSILESAINSVNPELLVKKNLKITGNTLKIRNEEFNLSNFENVYVVGMGKGAPSLCNGLIDIFGKRIKKGLIISGEDYDTGKKEITSRKGDHPIPGKDSFNSALELKNFISNIKKDDLVIALITGGSSAMLLSPPKGIDIDDISDINNMLIRSGASIHEINCLRKHLSTIKGGQLAKMIHPAKIISLLISDVSGSDPGVIGSGPFSGDTTTFQDALDILQKYSPGNKAGKKILDHLKRGAAGKIEDTPGPDDPIFKNNRSFIIGENITALNGAKTGAVELGFTTKILSSDESGDVRVASERYGKLIRRKFGESKNSKSGFLLLSGGEFTVNVTGNGEGGRVQEFLLHLLLELKDISNPFFITGIGTDGRDGKTEAAGAWINENTYKLSGNDPEAIISRYLKNNDSYNYFKKLDQLIYTGTTGTNVMDVFLFFLS